MSDLNANLTRVTNKELARQLRERLRCRNIIADEVMRSVPDESVIESYATCASCGQREISEDTLRALIKEVRNEREFIDRLDQIAPLCRKSATA